MASEQVKRMVAALSPEQIIAALNVLEPDTRSAVVFHMLASHLREAHADNELPLVLGQCLEARGVGLLVIDDKGPTWRTAHAKLAPRAADVARILEVVTEQVEGAVDSIALLLGLEKRSPS